MRRALVVIVAFLALPAPTALAEGGARIIVQRAEGLRGAERAGIRAAAGVELVRPLRLPATEVVTADDPDVALAALRSDPDVVYAELDGRRRLTTADRFFDLQWTLDNTGANLSSFEATPGKADADMDVPAAWGTSTGAGAKVGVVDTGVDGTHPDLLGQLDEASRDFLGVSDWSDPVGHGTEMAGIVAALPNDVGTVGVAPGAKAVALRAVGSDGTGRDSDIAAALDYAGDHGVRIVNASLSGPAPSATIERAIADHPQTLYVVAAGNDGRSDDAVPSYPCNVALANVLCVGASTDTDERASFSNYGARSVDLFAPGALIVAPSRNHLWSLDSGTSLASANVAGEAALVLAAAPGLDAHGLKDAILQSGDLRPAFAGVSVTGRRANAAAAVALAKAGPIPADADGDGVPDSRDTCRTTAAGTANGCPPGQPTTLKAPSPAPEPVTPVVTVAPTDPDHDGRAGAADACPTVAARTANGCPLPALRSFRVTVARHSRRATARITASGAATVALRIQRRRCHGGRCGWQSVAARTQSGAAGRARLSRHLRRGRYRATVRLRSAAGAAPRRARAFRVR